MIPQTVQTVSLLPFVLILEAILAFLVICMPILTMHDLGRRQPPGQETAALRRLKRRLSRSRMMKLLQRLGGEELQYWRVTPVSEIVPQLTVCARCRHTDLCDQTVATALPNVVDISFCPNAAQLRKACN